MNIENIDIVCYVFSMVIMYIPFHFFEESLGNFPESMYQHKWIPERITYGHWMANNVFFYLPILLMGAIVFSFNKELLFLGLGILFWGIINFADHFVYTIIDRKISPGLFTGILFAIISVTGIISVKTELSVILLILSIVTAIGYSIIPIILSIIFHKAFNKIFI